jgi:HlyD family secretion protein
MKNLRGVVLLILILAIGGGAYWYFTTGKASANVSEKDLITAQRVDFPLIVNASGTLEATQSIDITPPQSQSQSSGRGGGGGGGYSAGGMGGGIQYKLIRMVDEGTKVSEGDFLLEFDTSDISQKIRDTAASLQREEESRQQKRSQFELNLKDQRLQLEQAKSELQKLEVKLSSQADLLSGIEVEKMRIQRDASRENVKNMDQKIALKIKSDQLGMQISDRNMNNYRRQMDSYMDAIDAAIVRAPVSGVAIYTKLPNGETRKVGDTVSGSWSIMQIPDLSTIMARIQVDEVDSGKLKVGQDVDVSVGAVRSETIRGRIKSIGAILKQAQSDRPQKYCDAYVELNKMDVGRLRPGMNLSAKIMVGEYPKVVVIPLSSVQERDGRSFVQVWDAANKSFSWREIQLKTNDGLTAVVESGVNADEKIRIRPKA